MKKPGYYVATIEYDGTKVVQIDDEGVMWVFGNEFDEDPDKWTFLAGPFTIESLMANGEMLAACKEALECLEFCVSPSSVRDRLRDAIAKAEPSHLATRHMPESGPPQES